MSLTGNCDMSVYQQIASRKGTTHASRLGLGTVPGAAKAFDLSGGGWQLHGQLLQQAAGDDIASALIFSPSHSVPPCI